MIKKIKGKIDEIEKKYIILDVAGIGYEIFLGPEILTFSLGAEKSFYTHLAIRENSWQIYGFSTIQELLVFELLLGISGVGPKAARGILDITTPESLKRAVVTGNSDELTKVSGIGKKNADKIILELRNKIEKLNIKDSGNIDIEVYETLGELGFERSKIREALEDVKSEKIDEKIKEALKILSKK